MANPIKLGEEKKREKPTTVSHVIDDGTLCLVHGAMKRIEPVLKNEINDIEEMEGIFGRVYIDLVTIVRAYEWIGAKTRPDIELEQLANNLMKRTPVMA